MDNTPWRVFAAAMSHSFSRRDFLKTSGAAVLAAGAVPSLIAEKTTGAEAGVSAAADFDFVFFTDAHLQPELGAVERCRTAFGRINETKADFAINGGDLVFDAAKVPRARAESLFDLYRETESLIKMPVHHTLGNHDLFALSGGPEEKDADAPKKMYQDRYGATYYSFDHKGVHFVVLDSINVTGDRKYETRIDAMQLAWLKTDLEALAAGTPVIVTSHAPLVTGFFSYAPPWKEKSPLPTLSVDNAYELTALFEKHRVLAVLQGHTHINEVVLYKGCQYITSGAICGDWWKGPRWGHPSGFTVVSVRGMKISHRYETF